MKKLLAIVAVSFGCASTPSIYKTTEREVAVLNHYQANLARWPVPHERRFIATSWGVAHVVSSGPAEAPPLLMLHAMGVGATMWRANIEALAQTHRVHCLDFIGDLGMSRLSALDHHPRDGAEVAAFLVEVLDGLGVERADVAGASYGGWAALNLATHAPARVHRLALLGPMGVAPATADTIARVGSLVLHPTDEKKRAMVEWTLGPSPAVRAELEEYMMTAMECHGRLAPPGLLTDDELGRIEAPVLAILGELDGPVGPPDPARARLKGALRDPKVVVLAGAGHMMSLERVEVVNQQLSAFFAPVPSSPAIAERRDG